MNWFVLLFLSGIFILSPYYKGLYFNASFYGLSVILSILFLMLMIHKVIKKDFHTLQRVLPIMLLPLCYLLSLFTAESPKGAIDSLLQWISYASFFILLFWLAKDRKIKGFLPIIFQATGAWIAIFTLLAYYGIFEYRGAFVADRFGSIFQYANTFGMLMAVFTLFSIIMLTQDKISKMNIFMYSLPLVPFIVCFIQSFSRGMFIIFPFVWLLGLFLLQTKKQWEYILFSFCSFGLSLLVYKFMEIGKENSTSYPSILLLVISVLIVVFLVFMIKRGRLLGQREVRLWKTLQLKKGSRMILPLLFILIGLLGFMDIKNEGLLYQQLPDRLQERIDHLNIGAATAQERIIFIKDASKMIADSPMIGFGGEGWASINKKYQHMPYISNKVHNGYLEWIIDNGWLGFILFIGVWIYFYRFVFIKYLKEVENTIQIAVLTSTIAIFLHSFLDFNFSYSTIWLIMLWLFVLGLQPSEEVKTLKRNSYTTFPAMILFLFTIAVVFNLFFSYRFMSGDQIYSETRQSKSSALKEAAIENAISYDPNNLTYHLKLTDIYLSKWRSGIYENAQTKLENSIQTLITLEPNNSKTFFKAGVISEQINKKSKAIQYYSEGLKIDHYDKKLYENSIRLKVNEAIDLKKNGKINQSSKLLQSATKDYNQQVSWQKYFVEHAPKEAERFNSREFSITDKSHYFAALSLFLQKKDSSIEKIITTMDGNSTEKEKICALTILALQRQGDSEKAQTLQTEYEKNFPHLDGAINNIKNNF